MKFDINKVYTCVNADKIKIGSKIAVANSLEDLKYIVVNNETDYIGKLTEILSGHRLHRFKTDTVHRLDSDSTWALAYLIKEPESLIWTDINVGDVLVKDNVEYLVLSKNYNDVVRHIFVAEVGYITDSDLSNYTKKEIK